MHDINKKWLDYLIQSGSDLLLSGEKLNPYGDRSYIGAALCVRGSYYFQKGYTQQVREQIIRCFEEYETYAKNHLTWVWRDEPPEGPDSYKYDTAPTMREMANGMSPNDIFSFAYLSGKQRYAVGEWGFIVWANTHQDAEFYPQVTDYLEFSVPISFLLNHPKVFESMFAHFAQRIDVQNGYAGYAMNLSLTRKRDNQPTEAHLTKLFQGLDIGENSLTASGTDMRAHLKTISWLTLINDAMLQAVGGVAKLRTLLPERYFAFYDVPPVGLLIQAGNYPSLVPVKETPMLASYVLLNHALRKARLDWVEFLHTEPSYEAYWLDQPNTDEWLARFDIKDDQVQRYLLKLEDETPLDEERRIPGLKQR